VTGYAREETPPIPKLTWWQILIFVAVAVAIFVIFAVR
jgi:hypothetical protein